MSFLKLLLLLISLNEAAAAKTSSPVLRFESALDLASDSGEQIALSIMSILDQHNIPYRIEQLPMQRGIEEIKKHRVSASMARIGKFSEVYDIPHYERVNFPVLSFTLLLVCDPRIEQKVKREPSINLKLGFLLGSTLALQVIKYIDRPEVTTIRFNSYRGGLSMLKKGRVDCLIGSDSVMEDAGIQAREFAPFRVNRVMVYELYIWLSKKFSHVRTILESELPKYPFDEAWIKKYRSAKSICSSATEIICPDGVIFKKTQSFSPKN